MNGSEQESVKVVILRAFLEVHILVPSPLTRNKTAKHAGNSTIRCGNDARWAG